MTITAVVGAQFGDEGKGRVVDYLAREADLVVRYQGGDNAGHTVVNDRGTFRLHLIPAGIFNPQTACLVGTGTVVNPATLLVEMDELQKAGVSLDNLWLSDRAQVVMPYHRTLDGLEEKSRGDAKIGTTGRGIGPAYSDKAARSGVRLGDLLRSDWLRERLSLILPRVNRSLEFFGEPTLNLESLISQCAEWGETLGARIVDPVPLTRGAVEGGKNILLEGQLGVMRDIDWGTYPFVTSSHPIAAYAAVGAGIPPRLVTNVIGVAKAYATAVGAGPFPAELHDETGAKLREIGHEYGATTGRPRRTGWYDAVVVRYGAWINGMTGLALTKLDVLDTFPEIKICTAYRLPDGRTIDHVPDTPVLDTIEPIYETWPGWMTPTTGARSWDQLPQAARKYLKRLEEVSGVRIQYVSVGPERDEMFAVKDS
ncbi:MAG: adenylosuccinate synthase [Chloroflexi bacterium]|nr:adenylosuccinate synthase [Chloroflexota bacterium]